MRGHEPIVAQRLRGRKPASCWVVDSDGLGITRDWQQWDVSAATPHVLIEPGEQLQRLDLRFVVGLDVFLDFDDFDRMVAVSEACKRAGAARVVGMSGSGKFPSAETLRMIDTHEVFCHG
jgi:hypothetical protein